MQPGQQMPDVQLDAYHDNAFKKIRLSDYKNKWLVLIFYPADFTFVCPTELAELADHYEEFKKADAEILSISTDTHFVHAAWHDDSPMIKKIKFPMLADPTGKASKLFGTYMENEGLSWRATFIVDPDGIIKSIEMHDNGIGRSSKEILRKLLAAKFVRENKGEVCPASWNPGDKTIKPGIELIGKL